MLFGLERVSTNQALASWQLLQETFPVSPTFPSPLLAPTTPSGPEMALSKKNLCPSAAALGSSACVLVGLGGSCAGSGDIPRSRSIGTTGVLLQPNATRNHKAQGFIEQFFRARSILPDCIAVLAIFFTAHLRHDVLQNEVSN